MQGFCPLAVADCLLQGRHQLVQLCASAPTLVCDMPSSQEAFVTVTAFCTGAVFSNRLEDLRISELAEEDRKELVSGVQVKARLLQVVKCMDAWRAVVIQQS
jgi:hypothetical protein